MYTVDDNSRNQIEDDEIIEENSWNNGTGLIVKIIIIILCVLVLIWLIKALKSNSGKKDTGATHSANVLKLRLAAEEFFFVKDKKEKYSVVNLSELKSLGLVDSIVDANGKVCSENGSKASLSEGSNSYKMTISLDCSTNDDEEVFYYHTSNLACQNCNGKTIMNGQTNADVNDKEKEEEKEEEANDNSDIQDDNGEQDDYSCVTWSDWQENRLYDSSLIERTKTLVQGVKYGETTTKVDYSNWSDYTTTQIASSENIEVETKVVSNEVWSEIKTGTNIDPNSKNIKIISSTHEIYDNTCPSNYTLVNDKCYSNNEYVGNLSYREFNSGKYRVNNGLCESVKNIKYNDGKYELTYINCRYNEIIDSTRPTGSSKMIYRYQELISSNIVYYRYRTVTKTVIRENDIYTNQKYEEKDLPEGFVKVPDTEDTFYSYKLAVCEK